MLLPGLGLGGYRSFVTWQTIQLSTKVTVLAGINNSGKSNVLRFLQNVLPLAAGTGSQPQSVQLAPLDEPRGYDTSLPLSIGVPSRLTDQPVQMDLQTLNQRYSADGPTYAAVVRQLLSEDGETYWSRFELIPGKGFQIPDEIVHRAIQRWPGWHQTFNDVLHTLGGGLVDPTDTMRGLITSSGGFEHLPPVATIASARSVQPPVGTEDDWLSGKGLIQSLGRLQNPTDDQWQQAQDRWSGINDFVQRVLDYPRVRLRIPHDNSAIQVETPERVLPLSSLGSGIEQVVLLAAAATVTSHSLVCVEEPETNLHPLLQRKLLRFLTDETTNQYVIATHSSHLLDDDRTTAQHIRLTSQGSVVRRARRPHEFVRIFHDLGYRPSDLLQANCVLWVEGPSDRIYLREWLRLLDPELQEGIDFAIMFYGGRLLAHLSVSEGALQDFISLRQLNRSSVVLIDSDRTSSRSRLTATKRRLQQEFDESSPANGFAWVTKCYTIENYLQPARLSAAVRAAHPGVVHHDVGQWTNPLPTRADGPRFDKIAIARAATSEFQASDLDRFDLRGQVARLRDFIRGSNGTSIAPDVV